MRFNSWKDLIKDYARSSLEKNYSSLMYKFEKIDTENTGYIPVQEFKVYNRLWLWNKLLL